MLRPGSLYSFSGLRRYRRTMESLRFSGGEIFLTCQFRYTNSHTFAYLVATNVFVHLLN